MTFHDPRLHAYRPDLADEQLRGRVEADRYVVGRPFHIRVGTLPLRSEPSPESPQASELLFGEPVSVFDIANGWAWVQNSVDGYVGYVEAKGLASGQDIPTHRVSVLRTYLYAEANLKSPARELLSMNSPVSVASIDGPFCRVADGGWIWAEHLAPADVFESDHGDVAFRFVGTPYLWGGRSSVGLDCSGLVQMALLRCGTSAPRDSDMQAQSLGTAVPFGGEQAVLARGDLVFWPGHVGIWLSADQFMHANATHMLTVVEPFEDADRRIREATGDRVSVVRRP
ncbi:MAG: C40 family peptidase [Rhodospirillales bacterium]|nr:MAG: C40 family peptidase [Rhodospirillales bacterium]